MNRTSKIAIACVTIIICIWFVATNGNNTYAAEEEQRPRNLTVYVDDNEGITVRALDYFYTNNTYVSVRDMAVALMGTEKAFDVSVSSTGMAITTGIDYIATGGENTLFGEEALAADYITTYKLKRNDITKDGEPYRYYSMIGNNAASHYDCYITLLDMAMLLNLDIDYDGDVLRINSDKDFVIDINELEAEGFFNVLNSAIVGDATTGEIFYSYNGDVSVPMASTTKLMTYAVVMDAVTKGVISENEVVDISYEAQKVAESSDGVIKIKEGQQVYLQEALYGMLLPSSNEMAVALAEKVSGTEADFVKLMNQKAEDIGLSKNTIFYNCNGLPTFTNHVFSRKLQNFTTSNDMFKLASYLITVYPQITDITSTKSYHIESIDVYVNNTNPLLENLPGVVGLKTGTTTRSGLCLVTLMNVEMEDGMHRIVAAEFGAENASTRSFTSEVLLRYGKQMLDGAATAGTLEANAIDTPERLIQALLNNY